MSYLGTINQDVVDAATASGTVIGVCDDSVPEGQCLMFLKGTLMYRGPLVGRPKAAAGAVVILNPLDFAEFETFIKKKLH
jgi:hypothetical protein